MTKITCAAMGLDHRHIYGMTQGMIDAGCDFAGYWTDGEPQPLSSFRERFPDAPRHADRSCNAVDRGDGARQRRDAGQTRLSHP